MKTYKYILILMLAVMPSIVAHAQIGYQVSLLNSATGQPRAGETVTVDVKLTNSEDVTVYTTQQKATSNDFGVLSLSIGDAKTFDELDWNKLPLYIEVTIDGVLIAKSQVLNVPVAEYAKKSGFVLTKEFLASKTWKLDKGSNIYSFDFNEDGGYIFKNICKIDYDCSSVTISGSYYISNNIVFCPYYEEDEEMSFCFILAYNHIKNSIVLVFERGMPFD